MFEFLARSLILIFSQAFWHSEDRVSWFILITKDNEMHYFSNLFDEILYMFRTDLLSIIRSLNTLYKQQVLVMLVLLASASVDRMTTPADANRRMTTPADANRTSTTDIYRCVCSVELLLMVDSGRVRNI